MIGGKWRLPILWAIRQKDTIRYNELKRTVEGITNMMLSQSLKELESNGLIVRKQYLEMPPRVEYSLTEEGEELVGHLRALASWGKRMQKLQGQRGLE
ncbi:winged helix-turn-helix transcriptional regulator [Sutcliffiella halmapala]